MLQHRTFTEKPLTAVQEIQQNCRWNFRIFKAHCNYWECGKQLLYVFIIWEMSKLECGIKLQVGVTNSGRRSQGILTFPYTVMILSFRTDRFGEQCRPRSDCSLIRVYTVCHSFSIIWLHYSVLKPYSLNFRIITAIFRMFEFLGFLR